MSEIVGSYAELAKKRGDVTVNDIERFLHEQDRAEDHALYECIQGWVNDREGKPITEKSLPDLYARLKALDLPLAVWPDGDIPVTLFKREGFGYWTKVLNIYPPPQLSPRGGTHLPEPTRINLASDRERGNVFSVDVLRSLNLSRYAGREKRRERTSELLKDGAELGEIAFYVNEIYKADQKAKLLREALVFPMELDGYKLVEVFCPKPKQ